MISLKQVKKWKTRNEMVEKRRRKGEIIEEFRWKESECIVIVRKGKVLFEDMLYEVDI